MAGPGRTTSRRAEPHISDQAPPVRRAPEGPEGERGPGCGAGGWRQGQGGLQTTRSATHSNTAPPVWRAPEGPEGLAAAAVGGGGAWPGFETTRRAKLAARTARGRAAAHGRTKQPGPTSQARRVRPDGAQNTSGVVSTTGARANRPYSPPPGSGRPV